MIKNKLFVALEGNPNVGKTTFLNTVTGLNCHVGNWPGKTVEKTVGFINFEGKKLEIVDLPGIYSLTSYTSEERIARDFITNKSPDVIVDIIDATNLERNLYLTLQTLELTNKVIVVLNMVKISEKKGITIDVKALSKLLGVPVIPFEANSKKGLDDLFKTIINVADGKLKTHPLKINFGSELESNIKSVKSKFKIITKNLHFNPRWLAVKLLEKDDDIIHILKQNNEKEALLEVERINKEEIHHDPEIEIIDKRYHIINSIISNSVKREEELKDITERIDDILIHKYLGLPLLFIIFSLLFLITFSLSTPLIDLLKSIFSSLNEFISNSLSALNSPDLLTSLIVNGIITGVSSILIFLPLIGIFFILFAILEDSGYLSRAAFIIDRVMHSFGLQGRSFLCLSMGFGCNVPAIMSTRTLKDEKEKLITILLSSLIPCEARIGVLVLIIGVFFTGWTAALITTSLLGLNILLLILLSFVFKKYLFKGEHPVFMLEMPPYRVPNLKTVLITSWNMVKSFITRAGTLILTASIIIWFLMNFPPGSNVESSYLGLIGKSLSPIAKLLGFDWTIMVALISSFTAKELSVSTLSIIYGVGGMSLSQALQLYWNPLIAVTFLAVQMIFVPCLATTAVIKKETNSWKWTIFSIVYLLSLAFIVGLIINNVGSILF